MQPNPSVWSSATLRRWLILGVLAIVFECLHASSGSAQSNVPQGSKRSLFAQGTQAFLSGDYAAAVRFYSQSASEEPSAGAYVNLGHAEWKLGHVGPAILAWERAQWLDPLDPNAKTNLRFVRKQAQLDAPNYTWYELCSAWLPSFLWAWLASLSFWVALGLLILPGLLSRPKTEWQQGLAAGAFAIFLLTLPALAGIQSRSAWGVIIDDRAHLRITPTEHAQMLTKLNPGELAKLERRRGDFWFVRANNTAAGWIKASEFSLISP
jgi:tetratricopeptide (TPR) repeat protein